jgi:hypothetical protein
MPCRRRYFDVPAVKVTLTLDGFVRLLALEDRQYGESTNENAE